MLSQNIVFIVAMIAVGCAVQKTTTTTQPGKYSEDLSIWRPKVEASVDSGSTVNKNDPQKTTYVEPRLTVNQRLDTVLDSINRIHLERKTIDGFTIQIYSGLKRDEALTAKKELATAFPDIDSQIQYNQPNFRVKAGKYYTHLDAQRDYTLIKRYFPSAILIPDKISIE